jgi:hypothetical protein
VLADLDVERLAARGFLDGVTALAAFVPGQELAVRADDDVGGLSVLDQRPDRAEVDVAHDLGGGVVCVEAGGRPIGWPSRLVVTNPAG